MTSNNRKTGNSGENIACHYLASKGHRIIVRNYWKPFGEIDIITEHKGTTHFVEVKSQIITVSREKFGNPLSTYNPLDKIDAKKQRNLKKIISFYLANNATPLWQIDAIAVFMNMTEMKAHITHIKNIVIE